MWRWAVCHHLFFQLLVAVDLLLTVCTVCLSYYLLTFYKGKKVEMENLFPILLDGCIVYNVRYTKTPFSNDFIKASLNKGPQ